MIDNILDFLDRQKTRIFWILFIIMGIFLIGGILVNVIIIDILLGLIIIVIGVQKLDGEWHKKRMENEQGKIKETLGYMAEWVNASHGYMKKIRNSSENRIFRLDNERVDLDKKMEKSYRELVRKICELENKMNEITMSYTRGKTIRSGRR